MTNVVMVIIIISIFILLVACGGDPNRQPEPQMVCVKEKTVDRFLPMSPGGMFVKDRVCVKWREVS